MHILVAAYLGYEPPAPAGQHTEANGELAQVLSTTPVDRSAPALDNGAWQRFAGATTTAPRNSPHHG